MKCFLHNQCDAVGICQNCGKGLCTECVIDLGSGLACIDTCHNAVKVLIKRKNFDRHKTYELSFVAASIAVLLIFLVSLIADVAMKILLMVLGSGFSLGA